ncbi:MULTISPECIES: aminoacyl-tRNA hydrolase [Methylomonas]|uniref:Peptidyl-tRNA hydrolase n=1 Tax=Methylomonas koyamae TaxID=702114 RepID=A0A177P2Y9_9GAMM|nr:MULTISPECIES: aminoacyl-tRNA hydrolase [Methylomonas]NJA05775.1 aminoacyl-tRNA hydrolase [Methylococcaceae bacterium WWC4]OAI23843.1 aminoacyl-tRNA hydrolase [Methylomonas koyamae]OHX37606.1 aminoacyl-tRNA hydrolase [Methylomonas sp. LWB]
MIKVLVGLGNPGRQYEKTRHNVGFLFLDHLLLGSGGRWRNVSGFEAEIGELVIGNKMLVLVKPQTFMNRSGSSVTKVLKYYKFAREAMLVAHDDLELPMGVVKTKQGGGHSGHNGLRDIIAHLGSNEFARLRFGIGRPDIGERVADYVLSSPSKEVLSRQSMLFDAVSVKIEGTLNGEELVYGL